jgi:hypothetical protein
MSPLTICESGRRIYRYLHARGLRLFDFRGSDVFILALKNTRTHHTFPGDTAAIGGVFSGCRTAKLCKPSWRSIVQTYIEQ